MKYSFLFFTFLFNFTTIFGQKNSILPKQDTVYYLRSVGFLINTENRKEAIGFGFKHDGIYTIPPPDISANRDSTYLGDYVKTIFYLQSNTILAEFDCYDKKNKKNNVSVTYTLKNGRYVEYYISGKTQLECNYLDDKLDGKFTVFYENGKIKRQETWKKGEWTSGKCFDEAGNETAYCSYQEPAEFVGGLPALFEFIGNTLKYPEFARKNDVEATVYVKFIVETDGSIKEIEMLRKTPEILNQEAIRIVKAMPKWKPAKFEGVKERTSFILPINFRLE